MPGMLTPRQMEALRKAKGSEFDHLFLTGMIQHHNGALTMVKDLFDTAGAGQDAELFNFATDVDSGQRAEIRIMQGMLEKKNSRGETMNRVPSIAFCVAMAAMILFPGVNRLQAQGDAFAHTSGPDAVAHAVRARTRRGRAESVCTGACPRATTRHDRFGYKRSARKAGHRVFITQVKPQWGSSTFSLSKSLLHFNLGLIIPMIQRCRRCWRSSTRLIWPRYRPQCVW